MTDYLYGSARIRALEAGIFGKEKIGRLMETKSVPEAYAVLAECGIPVQRDSEGGKFLREETLQGILKTAYGEIAEVAPGAGETRLWLYQYDCNNIKAAIKAFIRKIDPRPLLFDFGTVDAEEIVRMAESGNYDALPRRMALAAAQASAEYAKTHNPQVIDMLLDRACYADMLDAASASRVEFAVSLVRMKIDLTNLLICVRILRMRSGEAGRLLLEDSLIPGGTLAPETILSYYAAGEKALWEKVWLTSYSRLTEDVADHEKATLTEIERAADNCWMELIKTAKFVPYGAEVLIGFLLAHEYEVRNLRIILAGKEAGLNNATILERIRESYV